MSKRYSIIAFISAAILLLTACSSGGQVMDGEDMVRSYTQISQEEAKQMMEQDGTQIIVDVRTQEEYDSGHIPGAICIPNESIGTEQPEELLDLEQIILIYCRSGNRSKQAAQKLFDMGYTNVYEFGGIIDWTGEITTDNTGNETEPETPDETGQTSANAVADTDTNTGADTDTNADADTDTRGGEAMSAYTYQMQEIWVQNGDMNIYGIAYVPDKSEKVPLVIFSHELGNDHTSGERYAERLAEAGYAAYVFDFCGGTVGGNKSDGSNKGMSILTEASDLEAVLEASKSWDFVDPDRIVLLGGSMGGLVTTVVGSGHQDEIAGMILMYPALSAKEDSGAERYKSEDEIPEDVSLFGGWIHVGKNYITDLWTVDFNGMLSSYRGHMLLLHGDKDGTVPLSWSEDAKEIIPDCEFYVIKNGGHEFFGQPFEDAMSYILPYLDTQLNNEAAESEETETMIQMKIGETNVAVDWEENESVEALKALCQDGPLTIQMSMYGGFEQVGSIGQNIVSNDQQTTTQAGDIVLYSSDQIVIFYGSNSWAYTRLGHADLSQKEMEELLGNGDVILTLQIKD